MADDIANPNTCPCREEKSDPQMTQMYADAEITAPLLSASICVICGSLPLRRPTSATGGRRYEIVGVGDSRPLPADRGVGRYEIVDGGGWGHRLAIVRRNWSPFKNGGAF